MGLLASGPFHQWFQSTGTTLCRIGMNAMLAESAKPAFIGVRFPVQPIALSSNVLAVNEHDNCYFSTENLCTVVCVYVPPGSRRVLGNSGRLGESGKCWASRQNAPCLGALPVAALPSRKFPV